MRPPRLAPEDDDRPVDGVAPLEPVEPGVGHRAQVLRGPRVPGVAHHGVGQGDPVRREQAGRHERRRVPGDRGEQVVLGAVVDEQQRGGDIGREPDRRPDAHGHGVGRLPLEVHRVQPPLDGRAREPPRRRIGRQLQDRTVPERRRHGAGVARVEDGLGVRAPVHGEPVLEPLEGGRRQLERPAVSGGREVSGTDHDRVAVERDPGDGGVVGRVAEPDVARGDRRGHLRRGRS